MRTLRISFDTPDALRREYANNISNGGIFVETNVDFEVREAVSVEIRLAFNGDVIELEGEVVHVVSPGIANAVTQPGVAVHFAQKASELRERFAGLIGTAAASEDEAGTGEGVRHSPRVGAVMNAHLETADGRALNGETRNVSRGGALLEVDDPLLAVGEKVELCMTRPDDGSQVRVGARVVREDREDDGGIELGLEFDAELDELTAVGEFVDEVRAEEHKRRLGGIAGAIAELGIEHLLQMFCSSSMGTLTVFRGDQEGYVIFQGGLVRAVRLGGAKGRKAMARILEWREGRFEFHANADLAGIEDEPLSLDAALLDAMRLMDETRREEVVPLPREANLRVDQAAIDAIAAELTKGEGAILELAQVGMNVGRILDIVPEPDAEIAILMHGLVERGLLTVVE